MKKLIAIMAFVLALAAASAALASPPRTESQTLNYGPFTESCGDFDIEFWGTNASRTTTYFDQEGNPTRIVTHVQLSETDRNMSTGTTLDARGRATDVIDLVTGTETLNGQVYIANVAGSGVVLQDTGKIVFNSDGSVVIHGPHDVFESAAAVFCEALAS